MSSTPPSAAERIVVATVLELRAEPDHRSECVTECPMGARLRLHDAHDGERWLLVRAPDGYRAWARSWGCAPAPGGWPRDGAYVSEVAAALHAEPRAAAASVAWLTMGCRLSVRGRPAGAWREVETPEGIRGWIPRRALERDALPGGAGFWDPAPESGLPEPEPLVFATASWSGVRERVLALLGTPYRWGGASAMGLDCSGLVRLAFGLSGVALPRDSRDQAAALRRFRVEEEPHALRAGDLVFFGEDPAAADHVGIGMGPVPGRFAHASGKVLVASLDPADPLFEAGLAARVCAIARPAWGP
jgi:hypothetical protein